MLIFSHLRQQKCITSVKGKNRIWIINQDFFFPYVSVIAYVSWSVKGAFLKMFNLSCYHCS